MKFSAFLLALFVSIYARAEDCEISTTPNGLEEILRLSAQQDCIQQHAKGTELGKVKAMADEAQRKGDKVVRIFGEPSSRTSSTVTYKFPEQRLKPGESLYFALPADISRRPIRFAILGHRQDPNNEQGWDPSKKWDNIPGLTSLQFHSTEQGWRYWRGDASGTNGAKYAEVRVSPELENYYDWAKIGHGAVGSAETSHAPLFVDAIRALSVGKDDVLISEVTLKVLPEDPRQLIEHRFSPGTNFGDLKSLEGRAYGGGQAYKGLFPGALSLPAWGGNNTPLPAGWRLVDGKLHIPIPKGKSLLGAETAVGDSRPDKIRNKDGGWGTPGWSRLSMHFKKAEGRVDTLMRNENVPPEGVLMGTPVDSCYVAVEGDELVIEADSDTSYLMGVRIWLK